MSDVRSLDYTQFREKGKKGTANTLNKVNVSSRGVRWWLADKKTLPDAVFTQVAAIIQADKGRIDSYNTYAKLYGTWTPTFWNGYQLASSGRPSATMRERLTYNIVQSCIDTLTSRISQNKPKPMFLTEAGD